MQQLPLMKLTKILLKFDVTHLVFLLFKLICTQKIVYPFATEASKIQLGAPLSERASSFQVEASVPSHAWKVLATAQARTKKGETALPTRGQRRAYIPKLPSLLLKRIKRARRREAVCLVSELEQDM